ncbi:EVE domain-containing protein [Tenacibaculum finnmarkense genomovar ulcerans]|uniref:AAA family ATPase n=1 Tax=Tenacibaculum finnmarkense TaxID=2781243 RepID=UPI001E503E19|nr:AAA family ATPase [Tenacibaculum finnmarkense]MCD8453785.1 EVE domain-containing protein [Tenacibaculum finnmarkense genomovar ulcerans]
MNTELENLKQQFLEKWPIEKLQEMEIQEYTNTNREDSFCYWVEHITRDLGSIVGGSSYKFGVFKKGSNTPTPQKNHVNSDGEYTWYSKYGETAQEAFEKIKEIIITIATNVQTNNLEAIDSINLGTAYKWKIAFLYGNYNIINIFKLEALRYVAKNLQIPFIKKTPVSTFHREILKQKKEINFFEFSHDLWQQYANGLIDIKEDFANWLNINTHNSYRNYLGDTTNSIVSKLDEINSYFDEIDFFLVNPLNIKEHIDTILVLLSKTEREKNADFEEYDLKNSNGIPKALLGKNNYIQFLREKFIEKPVNYWVFQGNPNIYNITEALKNNHLESWRISAHKDKIKKGDKAILWQSGKNAGCYALLEITSDVLIFNENELETQHYLTNNDNNSTERVKIKVLKNFVENPILQKAIKEHKNFNNFKGGNQGTNFTSTKLEYSTLFNWNSKKEKAMKNSETTKASNQILYGPPGTGKTYVTKKLAVELIDKKKYSDTEEDRKIIIDRYNELHKKEQIVFTTFHQSISYEDFVEGIKPKTEDKKVTYEVEDGIFKKLVTEACYSIAQETKKESLCKTLDFFGLYDSYLNTISERLEQEDTVELSTKSGGKVYITEVSQQGNFLVTHKNGTRSYTVSKERLSKLNKGIPNLTLISNIHDTFRKIIGGSNASVYWAVLNELHKQNKEQGKKYKNISEENIISYQDKLEIVNSLSNNDYSIGTKKPYVLIIDEINRGNVSAIFGELITLLEPDKRLGQNEAITVKLPYSKKEFGVPSNLHIIGTMNTADRSVESLDTALRRRFEFKEILPKPSLLKEILFDSFNLKDILETINNRIELLLDRDHTIGHSYFITIESGDTTKLATVFNNNVIPLLQEYFYGDYGKIGLVLGKGFIRKKENNKINFADFKYENSNDFKTPSFELEKIDAKNIIDAIHKTLGIKTDVQPTEVKQVTPELANV